VPFTYLCEADSTADFHVHVNGTTRIETTARLNQYALQIDDFASSIHGERPLRFQPEDAIRNMKVNDSCMESAARRYGTSCNIYLNMLERLWNGDGAIKSQNEDR
jgi:predicted dehydrogenase